MYQTYVAHRTMHYMQISIILLQDKPYSNRLVYSILTVIVYLRLSFPYIHLLSDINLRIQSTIRRNCRFQLPGTANNTKSRKIAFYLQCCLADKTYL